ncbi:RICIN domain-containing protein [Microbacterium panaciterrae]|uniref:RICIN domain-containing protein n=1 Tax=Microbacterium panaciterrae TaxID=985759 RepID=UPI0031E8FF52
MYYQGQLVVYFSDQRQNSTHSQLLDHETSTDGVTWSAPVNDVVYASQAARPGMTTVAQMNNSKWILTYELCQTTGGSCPVYYKISTDPLNFNAVAGQQILPTDGSHPCCQPYVAWTPSGGANGTIVVSAGGQTPLLINTAGGASGSWQSEDSNAPYGYSRSLMVMPDGGTVMTMSGGSHDSTSLNPVQWAFDNVAPSVSSGARYTLANSSSGLDLAIGGGSTADGAAAIQWSATGGVERKWVIARQPDAYFTITNVNSGKVLGIAGAATANGAVAQQQTPIAGSSTQEWSVVKGTDGTFTITNRKSNLPLEDPSFSTANGTGMDQWTDNGGSNQHWTLTQTALPALTTGQFALENGLGKYLEIPAGSTAAGTQADQFWYANQGWHLWAFVAVAGGFEIVNSHSGLALTDEYTGGSSVVVDQQPATASSKQLWSLVPSGSTYLVKNSSTGRYLATAAASSADGAPTVSWTATGGPEQAWTIQRIN